MRKSNSDTLSQKSNCDTWALPTPAMDTLSCFLVAYCKRIKLHLKPRGKIHSELSGLMSEDLSASALFVLR